MMTSRKILATFAVVFLSSAVFPSVATAAPKPSNKPITNSNGKILCKNTTASGHKAKKIPLPVVDPNISNRTMTINTNCGDVVIQAFGELAPVTVSAMKAMANSGFLDKSLCHRITTDGIYVLQCGDPTATGKGGPNFRFSDENLPQNIENNYPAGTVAMANSGAGTNGSQFFIVYKDTYLPPNYSIWGKVSKGLEIIQAVAKNGVKGGGTDGAPKTKIAIEKVTVR
jgi:peptidyl-prolyl cis-trans isomerase B (cyclophilin B)